MTTLPPHVQSSGVVLDDVRLVYVPVPKAGSTAVLWALLELVELDAYDFWESPKLEVTRSLTIHDLTIWGKHRLAQRARSAELFESEEWLTFTVVREPVRRIWSAWVSKILLRDPRFVALYGGEDWFPAPPRSADELVGGFRSFVAALADRPSEWHDPHWSSQADLIGAGQLEYGVVARVERLPGDLEPVITHLRRHGRDRLHIGRENKALVAFVPEVLDSGSWERCAELTARDREVFGYEPPARVVGDPNDAWVAEVEGRIPAIRAVIERNERIGDLKSLVTRRRAS